MSGPPINKNTSPSTQDIIDPTRPDPNNRPPAPLPEPVNVVSDEDYEYPNSLRFRQALATVTSIASTQWPSPYDEIQVRPSDIPPAVPPARKQTTADERLIPRTTSLPAAFPESREETSGRGKTNGRIETRVRSETSGRAGTRGREETTVQSLVSQNERPSTLASNTLPANLALRMPFAGLQLPDVPEKKSTSNVIPPPPRSLSSDNPPTPAAEQGEHQYGNMPLPRNLSETSLMPPTGEARELCDSNRPALHHHESNDSVTLDPDGYIKCIP